MEQDGWQVTLPLEPGENTVTVEIEDKNGEITKDGARAVVVSSAVVPSLDSPVGVAWDSQNQRAFVIDDRLNGARLFVIDVSTGSRTVVSDDVTGSGPPLECPVGVVWEPDAGRALVTDWCLEALIAIDVSTGSRTVVSEGVGLPFFFCPAGVVWEPDAGRALVTDSCFDVLIEIDVDTGDRRLLASFFSPSAVAWDSNSHRVLVTESGSELGLATLDRASLQSRAAITQQESPARRRRPTAACEACGIQCSSRRSHQTEESLRTAQTGPR
ncbi:MAG: hypothetical protein Tsb0020_01010 [Haliangiales bacterium]